VLPICPLSICVHVHSTFHGRHMKYNESHSIRHVCVCARTAQVCARTHRRPSSIYQQWDFMKETDGGEGAFEHLPVMYPLISINYILHTARSNDKTMSSRPAPPHSHRGPPVSQRNSVICSTAGFTKEKKIKTRRK
jgi:hypothetical protein